MTQLALHHIQICSGGDAQSGKSVSERMDTDILQFCLCFHRIEQFFRVDDMTAGNSTWKDVWIDSKLFKIIQYRQGVDGKTKLYQKRQ
jgi:hypothetical protein